MKLSFREILIVLLTAALAACATVGPTGRHQLMMVSESDEINMGAQQYNQIKAQSQIIKGTAADQQVQRVGKKIAAVAGKNYAWEFILINSPQVNAFCLPGGKVAVYSGILPVTKDDTGLAVVLGHEIAHALARHGAERMSQQSLLGLGGQILGAATNSAALSQAYGVGTTVGLALPFSRKQESEADDIGLILMAKAGYNPSKAVDFWQRMSQTGGAAPPALLSTHPADASRIKDIQTQLPQAMQYYYAAGGK